ncbi:MAG: hypothetical protein R2788_02190 [Saprospiraceae bacterium]
MKQSILLSLCLYTSLLSAQIGVNIGLPERVKTYIDLVKENYRWNELSTGNALNASRSRYPGWPTVDAQYIVRFPSSGRMVRFNR